MPKRPVVPNALRKAVVDAARHLFDTEVMSHAGHANLSARIDPSSFVLTTTGVVRHLSTEQLAAVNLDGEVLDGELDPENAEIVSMHSAVYRARAGVGAIIHTHSPSATAFALANRTLPCRLEPLLRFGQTEPVPLVAWGPRGSEVSVRSIEEVLEKRPTTSAVLLANHGLLAFGPDPQTTARLVVAIEEAAEAELGAEAVGGGADLPPDAVADIRSSMARHS